MSEAGRGFIRLAGRPVRRASGARGLVLQPYRGYGSAHAAFMIGRVVRQRSVRPARGAWDFGRHLRDLRLRMSRSPVSGARVTGTLLGVETATETDADGYFRLEWRLFAQPPAVPTWSPVALRLHGGTQAEAVGEVYLPPAHARFAVISDIDDTVMRTGVANKLVMMWRLFVQDAESRTAFPGVAALYRALHDGAGGDEGNPMLYVSRAPWGIYDVLDEFFRQHEIPAGPVLFLREWGMSWRKPLPRKAEDHKRVLIEAIMKLYGDLPFVLIGDSGQHDPQVYRDAVETFGDRVRAIYIRDLGLHGTRVTREIAAIREAVAARGTEIVLASDTLAMARHAAGLGLIRPESVETIRQRHAEREAEGEPRQGPVERAPS